MAIFGNLFSKEAESKKENPFQRMSNKEKNSELDKSAARAKEQYPEDSKTVEEFMRVIKDVRRVRRKKAHESSAGPMNAEARFFLSQDRLAAYACLLPPKNGGGELTLEAFLEDMRYEGIVYGILEETIPNEFSLGYYHVFPVARGTLPQSGEDGKVVEMFQRCSPTPLSVQDWNEVDFNEHGQFQPIRKGTVICEVCPETPGTDGKDVTGTVLSCPPVVSVHLSHGENVSIGEGNQTLIADVDGILYIENDRFCIHEQKIVEGDLDQSQGSLHVSGNLYIGGNVDGGVSVKATGNIVINGKVGQARVTSTEGTIYVRQGICGADGKTSITAAGQVQAPIIEYARVEAGDSVITETVSNSNIQCGGSVYAMAGRGMIISSQICARDSIQCQRIGNVSGGRSKFLLGHPPGIQEKWTLTKMEITETQSTIDSLWQSVLKLQRKGNRLSEDEKSMLEQLKQQRDMYLQSLEDLKKELKEMSQTLDQKNRGKIQCEKLHPVLEVQFGRLTKEIVTEMGKCNIHVENGVIRMQ